MSRKVLTPKVLKVLTPEELNEQSHDLFAAINGQSDLAAVLIGASWVEQALGTLLQSFFIQDRNTVAALLEPPHGAVSTFTSRINLAYGVGLISESISKDLRQIAHIRNRFAHSHLNVSFETEAIKTECDKLTNVLNLLPAQYITFPTDDVTKDDERGQSPIHMSRLAALATAARNKFVMSVAIIGNRIMITILDTQHRERWPD